VIAPMVNSVADARAFAASMKYPPVGQRSWGAGYAMARHRRKDAADWLATANSQTLAFAMVETREALEILDDILAAPGIDGIFVGPSDFSIAWTNGTTINPGLDDMMDAIAGIGRRTRAAGKHAAIYIADPALTGRYVSYGYRLLALGTEQKYMALGATALLDAARATIR
jgi:4-hydroxy-2-oxoheptanedioate aldolase